MKSRRPFLLIVLAIVIVEVLLDQWSKVWAVDRLSDHSTISLLPTLEFDLSYNSGFSFSTGSGQGKLIGYGVIILVGVLIRQIVKEAPGERALLMGIILGGALGNLCDRFFRAESGLLSGHVVDFIDVSWFAVFNVADIFVVGGAIFVVLLELIRGRQAERATLAVADAEAESEATEAQATESEATESEPESAE